MGKGRLSALVIALAIIGLALMRTATASHTTDHKAFSAGADSKGLVVKTDTSPTIVEAVAPDWQPIDSRGFQIPAGESQLIGVDFFAESICDFGFNGGIESTEAEYTGGSCYVRVLVGRTLESAIELEPASGADAAFDTPFCCDGPEYHALNRSLCVRNATGSPANVTVWLEAATGITEELFFGLDDWSFRIARNSPCSPSVTI